MKRIFVCACLLLLVAVVAPGGAAEVIKVKVAVANVRAQPDLASAVVARVKQGDLFEPVRKVDDWYEIAVADASGRLVTGYLMADLAEVIGAGAPVQAAGGIRAGQLGAQGARQGEEPAPADRPSRAQGLRVEFGLGGGLGMIGGGDFNAWIRGSNAFYNDLNDYYASETAFTDTFSTDWPEWKSTMNFKGEVVVRFNRTLGVGLGVEFLTKSFRGTEKEEFRQNDYRTNYAAYYQVRNRTDDYIDNYDYPVSVIPITLSAYGFFPIGSAAEAYVTGGAGYYMGKIKSNYTYVNTYDQLYDYYRNSDNGKFDTWKNKGRYDVSETLDVTSNTIGFHIGAGLGYALAPNITVFAEALYRMANFKEWKGSYREEWTDQYNYGYQSEGYQDKTETGQDSYDGTLYTYTYHSPTVNKDYPRIGLYEGEPAETSTRSNFVKTAVDVNGIAFRIGVRIGFGRQ